MDNRVELPKKLYKYCSLSKERLEFVLDIILNQRLYCSTYPELNDPFEGIFATTLSYLHHSYKPIEEGKESSQMHPTVSGKRGVLIRRALLRRRQDKMRQSKTYTIYKKVEELLGGKTDAIKICSLSSNLNDVRLWSYYSDGHRGIVFEIDFSGLETRDGSKIIHEVTYHKQLPYGLSPRDRITLLGAEVPEPIKPHKVLTHKTEHWVFESEYRIIEESKHLEDGRYFDIKGRIKSIYLGTRTSPIQRELLKKIVPSEILIYTTKINKKTIKVEPGECISERNISP